MELFICEYSRKNVALVGIVTFIIAVIFLRIGKLPWNVDILPITFFYCYLGFVCKEKEFNRKLIPLYGLISMIVLCSGNSMDIHNRYWNTVSFITAYFIIYIFCMFSRWITSVLACDRMVALGENSLYAFCIHHLERTEIGYIWRNLLAELQNILGSGLAYWIVCIVRVSFVIVCLIAFKWILHRRKLLLDLYNRKRNYR